MRLDLFFGVGGQRPFVSANRRRRALDTLLEGEGTKTVSLPSGDKCIIVNNLSDYVVAASVLGGSAHSIEAGGSVVLPGREQHVGISIAVPVSGKVRLTVIQ